ncbi:MAG: hypothetical protein FWH32_07030 [Clostridiales bacterium]|nr:hypothetical protein [Clostridiales bacterium]
MEHKKLKEEALEGAAGGGTGGPFDPIITGCWFKSDGGSEMRNGVYRIKCRTFDCKSTADDGGFIKWYQCRCWGTDKCVDSWHHETVCV